MFNSLQDKLDKALHNISGRGKITEINVAETVKEITENGGKVSFVKVNTAVYAEVEAATKEVVEKFGTLDIIINNAAIHYK